MSHELKTIHVHENSEIARLLEEADGHPVRLERAGVAYRLIREEAGSINGYSPVAVQEAVHAVSGMLTSEEGEALKSYIYLAREQGSRPPDRP